MMIIMISLFIKLVSYFHMQGNTALHIAFMNSNMLVAEVISKKCSDLQQMRNKVSNH